MFLQYCKIWTNCEHDKNDFENSCFQNFQINTCKKGLENALFLRISEGCCGNEEKPEWALTRISVLKSSNFPIPWKWREARMGIDTKQSEYFLELIFLVEMKRSPNGHWHITWLQDFFQERLRGNEEKPEWALTQHYYLNKRKEVIQWKWREARMGIDIELIMKL